ncbi:hypothetical protein SAMN05216388_101456 [Halorientalis persicus]|jgi:hypothetical protein|uniref:DUF8056 domain-containing protein n=1 Tax=Halorientalis persicus TaxID=1367881 RepID=A0A1H8QNU9_9EURY|nr:hypothetical protein [Halorientalis persicus]SEO55668.1 hypothetical protein SAMN05216388_101456 [Halorientalis persicus]
MTDAGTGDDEATYRGLLGAFPYALRSSDSRLYRSYVVIGGLLALLTALAFAVSVMVQLGNSAGTPGGVFTFSRAFIIFVGALVFAPLVAPVLYFARRRRIQGGDLDGRYDLAMGVAGYAFIFALYVGLVISIPECYNFGDQVTCRDPPSGLLAPVIRVLYALPPIAGLVPPTLAGLAIAVVDRVLR